jgi:hypothetical protein
MVVPTKGHGDTKLTALHGWQDRQWWTMRSKRRGKKARVRREWILIRSSQSMDQNVDDVICPAGRKDDAQSHAMIQSNASTEHVCSHCGFISISVSNRPCRLVLRHLHSRRDLVS